ncbi:MAG: ISNCY-like element ISRm17 family transposase [Rhodothermia bacterium]|nr:MAG: ISNCY-like element ISRm17 family transposase [Rhodothermia bacterium]
MRRIVPEPDLFRSRQLRHKQARELAAIDRILLANPSAAEAVWKDLQGPFAKTGRPGLSADQVLRAAIIKQMTGYSYSDLAFHVADSDSYRRFCGFASAEEAPRKSALAHSIKRITAATWEEINRILLGYAKDQGIEGGERVRIDPTVTESNIHAPTDNKLLFDCVRVLGRLLKCARKSFGVAYASRIKRAKRRHIEVMNAPNRGRMIAPYKDLLKVTKETIRYAEQAVKHLRAEKGREAHGLAEELERYIELAWRVVSQTERRVLRGESVPAADKIVSIFEPHTDIIRKDRRDTYYGHKVTLSGGRSGMILDWVVERGNPADSTLLTRMLDRLQAIYGSYPRQVSVDGGFASKENLRLAKEKPGVVDVAFAKKRGLAVEEMATSRRVYRKLRDFRAGIEGIISFLKRVFGLGRCTWRSLPSFSSYVGASIVAANLLILARHLM